MDKRWVLKPQPDKNYRQKFGEYSRFIQTILYQRGIKRKKEAQAFFDLDYEKDLHDFSLLSGIGRAVKRIKKAIKNKEKVAVYGDYDADGVTAATILYQFFKELGIKPVVYIPNRVKEGYGLNKGAGDYLKKRKVELVVTVDTGVRNAREVEGFRKKGIEVVITDHHAVPQKLPRAVAVVDPHKPGDNYPFKELSGAGVAFKLVQALVSELGEDKFSRGFEKWLLDLVAIGTIADLVPLMGENRVLVKYGLIVLGKTRRQGLKYLMEAAGVAYEHQPVFSTQVAFQIAPRINAAGRMDHANNAFVLLNEGSNVEAAKLAKQLEQQNRERQELTTRIYEEVGKLDFSGEKIIIAGSKSWPLGVLGLVSGRLLEKFSRPALIYTDEGEQIRGSARSIPAFNVIKALEQAKDILMEYGGHKQAAGFTLKKKDLGVFEKRMKKIAAEELKGKDLQKKLEIDHKIDFSQISGEILKDLKALEPFGAGNPEPLFLLRGAEIASARLVGKGQNHLKLGICAGGKKTGGADGNNGRCLECIGFNFSQRAGEIKIGEKVDLVFNLVCNCFNGSEYLELRLVDLKSNLKLKKK